MSNTARAAAIVAAVVLLGGLSFVLLTGADEPHGGASEILSAPAAADARPSPPSTAPFVGPTSERAQTLDLAASETASDAPATAAPADAAAAHEPTRALEVTGRVVDAAGRGVPEATVTLVPAGEIAGRAGTPLDDLEQATTDADGRFTIEARFDPPSEDVSDLLGLRDPRLAVRHEAFASTVVGLTGVGAREGRHDAGLIELERGALARGRIVDETGRPLEGATVTGRTHAEGMMPSPLIMLAGGTLDALNTVTSGRDGRFVVRGLRPGRGEISARLEGRRIGLVQDLVFDVDVPAEVGDLALEAGQVIAGALVDEAGAPIGGATVSVSSFARIMVNRLEDLPREQLGQEFATTATTDESGRFEVAGLSGGNYTVHARSPGLEPVDRQNVAAGTRDVVLVARRLGGLLVLLEDALTRAPIDGARIEAEPRQAAAGGFAMRRLAQDAQAPEVLTGAAAREAAGIDGPPAGAYFLRGLGSAGTTLHVLADGYARRVEEAPPVFGDAVETLALALVGEARLEGRVVSDRGEPVEGARVALAEPQVTMEDGEVRIERRVSIGEDEGETRHRAVTGADGRFVLSGVEAGRWELTASAVGFVASEALALTLEQGDRRDGLELVLGPAGAIAGTVFGVDGLPAAGQRVRARRQSADADPTRAMDHFLAAMFGEGGADASTTSTDADGRYRMDDLRPGPYEVALLAAEGGMRFGGGGGGGMFVMAHDGEGDTIGAPVRVAVEAGEVARADLTRPLAARIRGRVLAGGEPVPSIQVMLQKGGGFMPMTVADVITDDRGRFVFEQVDEGEYELACLLPGAAIERTADVAVDPGDDKTVDLVFGTGGLSGRIVDRDSDEGAAGVIVTVAPVREDAPAAGAAPRVESVIQIATIGPGGSGMSMTLGGGPESSVRTDADGRFEVRYLDAGTYTVRAEGGGFLEGETGPLDVVDGETLDDVRLELERGGVLRGTVLAADTGARLDDAPVRLVSADGGYRDMTQTNAGDFTFEGLSAGEYTVEVLGSGFSDEPLASEVIALDEGETRSVTLRADAQT